MKKENKNEEKIEEVAKPIEEEIVPEIVEEEDEGITKTLHISKQTFYEFYNQGGLKQKIKQTAILCAIMCLVLYLFSDRTVEGWGNTFLVNCLIYCGVLILTQIIAYVMTTFITIPNQFKKMNIENLDIVAKFNNKGIEQTIDGHTVKIGWEQIAMARESNNSFMFYGINRSGFVFSKEGLIQDEIEYISNLIRSKVMRYSFENFKIRYK